MLIGGIVKKDKWTFKDTLEMWEAIFTIIVSIMAIWGTLVAWENGFWHKLHHVVEHLHTEYSNSEVLNDVEKEIKKI